MYRRGAPRACTTLHLGCQLVADTARKLGVTFRCIRVPNGRIDRETRSLAVTLYFRDACAARRPQHGRALG